MTLDWKDSSTWKTVIEQELQNVLGNDYVKVLRNGAKSIRYRDDDECGCMLFNERASKSKIISRIKREVISKIKSVMAYHACRTDCVEQYMKNGIRILDPVAAQDIFRSMFSNEDVGIPASGLDAAIESVSLDTRKGRVYLGLDDRYLIEHCGHYLIYGSEYINCLAISVPNGGEHTRDILKLKGKATMLICEVPLEWINSKDLEYLIKRMLADHFFSIAHSKNEVQQLDFAIIRKSHVPASLIRGHYNPQRIPDPYKQRRIWNDDIGNY